MNMRILKIFIDHDWKSNSNHGINEYRIQVPKPKMIRLLACMPNLRQESMKIEYIGEV